MLNINKLVQEGLNFPATAGSALLWNGQQSIENRVDIVAKRVKNYLKGKSEISVSELVENLEESADIILRALRKLEKEGVVVAS